MKRKSRKRTGIAGFVAQLAAHAAFTRLVQSSSLCKPMREMWE